MKRLACLLAPLLLLALAQPACTRKPKPDPGPTLHYQLVSKDASLAGETVVVLGERRELKHGADGAYAQLSFPRSGPSALGGMSLEIPTPCGTKSIALAADITAQQEEDARRDATVLTVTVTPRAARPAFMEVWLDAGGQKVRVGEAELQRAQARLYEPGCKESSPVLVDGQPVGALDGKALDGKALFITGRKGVCYSLGTVVYGSVGGAPVILRDAQVHLIKDGPIDYFLKKAPAVIPGSPGKGPKLLRELAESPCP